MESLLKSQNVGIFGGLDDRRGCEIEVVYLFVCHHGHERGDAKCHSREPHQNACGSHPPHSGVISSMGHRNRPRSAYVPVRRLSHLCILFHDLFSAAAAADTADIFSRAQEKTA